MTIPSAPLRSPGSCTKTGAPPARSTPPAMLRRFAAPKATIAILGRKLDRPFRRRNQFEVRRRYAPRNGEGASQGLEAGLDGVVRIRRAEQIDVQGQTAFRSETPEKVRDQNAVEAFDALDAKLELDARKRPARKIERDARKRIVHRQQHRPVALDAASLAECIGDRLPERKRDVLDQMMRDAVERACGDAQIGAAMKGQLFEQMIEHA